jgi:RND family efflux transporter MFP subunit
MRLSAWLAPLALVALAPLGLVVTGSIGARTAAIEPVRGASSGAAESAPRRAKVHGDGPFLGVVLPRQSADVTPPVAGQIVDIRVSIGDRVRANDVIATLDSRLTQADLTAARAAASSQDVEREMAVAAYEAAVDRERRLVALAEHGLASGADVEAAKRESEQARLREMATKSLVTQRGAQVERLSVERKLMDVRAPFDGAIVARYVDPGAAVSIAPSRPIVRLISVDRLYVRFAIPKERVGSLSLGSRVRASTEDGNATLVGTVERIAPQVDPASHTSTAEASIEEKSGELVAGVIVGVSPAPP